MNLTNCPRCRKMTVLAPNSKICSDCVKEEAAIYKRVSDHLRENPGLSLMDLSMQTEVSTKKILGYVKEGSIQIIEKVLGCKMCGDSIERGDLCKDCAEMQKEAMLGSLGSLDKNPNYKNTGKMHTSKRRK